MYGRPMDLGEMARLLRTAMQDASPSDALSAAEQLKSCLEERQFIVIERMRGAGASWDLIARSLNITRQALQGRMDTRSRLMEPAPPVR